MVAPAWSLNTWLRFCDPTSTAVRAKAPFCASWKTISCPNLQSRFSGSCTLTIFSNYLRSCILIMMDSVESIAIKPTMTAAAALVFPASKTPALHRSVRSVIRARVSPAAEASRCRSGSSTNGRKTCNSASTSRNLNRCWEALLSQLAVVSDCLLFLHKATGHLEPFFRHLTEDRQLLGVACVTQRSQSIQRCRHTKTIFANGAFILLHASVAECRISIMPCLRGGKRFCTKSMCQAFR